MHQMTTQISDINNIPLEFQKKMEWLKNYVSTGSHPFIQHCEVHFVVSVSNSEVEICGPCGAWPNHRQIDAVISKLKEIQSLSPETIEQYNLIRETQAYESMIDDMMGETPKRNRRRKKDPVPGFIYLIADGHGNTKIGRTRNWKTRVCQFPPSCKPVLIFGTEDYIKEEKDLHTRYSNKCVQGEWFQLVQSDIQEIRSAHSNHIVMEDE